MFDYFLLVIKVLLHYVPYTTHHRRCYLLNRVKWRHQDQYRNFSISCQVASTPTADRSAHNKDIICCTLFLFKESIIKIESILFDCIGDVGTPIGLILTIIWILNRIESNIELEHQRLQEEACYTNVLRLAVEIYETFFRLLTLLC